MTTPMPETAPTTGPGMPAGDQPVNEQPQQTPDVEDGQESQETDWKAEARKHEARAKQNAAAAKRAKELEAELEKYREASQSETEKAISAARREAEKATTQKFTRQLATAEVRAAAGGRLQDPADAVRLIDVDDYINDNGDVDNEGIREAVAELVKAKPYLAVQADRKPPSFDGGQRAGQGVVDPDFNEQLRKGFRRR